MSVTLFLKTTRKIFATFLVALILVTAPQALAIVGVPKDKQPEESNTNSSESAQPTPEPRILLEDPEKTKLESTPSSDVPTTKGTKAIYEDKVIELNKQYLAEVEAYRRSEQNFKVLKQQYANLNTLKSLEEATVATKQAMYERSRVLTTYLEIVYFTLLDTGGINLQAKDTEVKALERQIEEMRAHTQIIEKASSRDDVNQLRDEFKLLQPELEDASYRSMSLISLGRHQTVYDQSVLIIEDLNSELLTATISSLQRSKLERAFTETDRNLESAKASIDKIVAYYDREDKLFNKQQHQRILKDLGGIYAQLSQVLFYLEELLRL